MSSDPLAEIRASFFVECEELLEGLHDALGIIADGRGDAEAVNTVFRAVHSIKGGAGAFGLEALVGFAHGFETVLDRLRGGAMEATADTVKLLYRAADLLQDHVRAACQGEPSPAASAAVLSALSEHGGATDAEAAPDLAFTPVPLGLSSDPAEAEWACAPPSATRLWSVRFTPSAALYASGNEAFHVLRTLCALGRASVACDIPADLGLADEDAERPRLSWRVTLEAETDRSEIEDVFDFVADLCAVEIGENACGRRSQSTEAPDFPPTALRSFFDPADHAEARSPRAAEVPGFSASTAAPAALGGTIRVDLEKIDRLMNLVGELVINQGMLSQSVRLAGLADPQTTAGLEALLTLTRDLQDSVMSVRAQPVKPLFQRMARVLREASAAVGKEVWLKTEGEATEVDKTVIERLAEPLTHMIRNAVDHGFEDPATRMAAGKPSRGQITLSAFHRAGRIVIEVADDGTGIDRDRVLRAARARGLVPPDALPTDTEIDDLVFTPGFSTAESVSAISGRGVGMDVVKSAVSALGGRIAVASEAGRGSTFSISLPLTLAVLEGMVIRAADQTFVVPLSAIGETAALTADAIRKVGSSAELLHLRGDLIPLLDLGTRLGFRPAAKARRKGIVLLTAPDAGPRAALIVDAVLEQRQVVIKGLGPGFDRMPGVAAATILADGNIALILDPADLLRTSPDLALAG